MHLKTPFQPSRGTCGWIATVAAWSLVACSGTARAGDFESDPINYSTASANNPVTRLQERLDSGQQRLERDEKQGYLRALLKALDVPESSQTLVFSRTSLQRSKIGPWRPRAIYFNDDVYVGFCQGGEVVEVSTADPKLGTAFYTLEQEPDDHPEFLRQTDSCLICHGSSLSQGLPGHIVRSVYPDSGGDPIFAMGSHRTDQASPLKERWGGWYVTGTHGQQTHLGNLIVRGKRQPEQIDNTQGQNVTDLSRRFTTSAYLTPHSDIVALMVLEHQTQAHNLITQANFQTRLALRDEDLMDEALKRSTEELSDSTRRRIQSACEPLVKYLLFSGEAALTDRIEGTSSFAEEFAQRGPFDSQGRSLRQFDLERRLFKYPCSYLVYSDAFDGLPPEARDFVLKRMLEVLTGKDTTAAFAQLSDADRAAILDILRETKPNLPESWQADAE